MTPFLRITAALALIALSLRGAAAEPADTLTLRPVAAAYTLEAGSSHLADTYLTPLHYDGWHLALRYSRLQAMRFDPGRWVMQLRLGAVTGRTMNPVRNATMWRWGIDASWAMMRRWWSRGNLGLMAGPQIAADLGALYSERNGNNPVSAKAAVTLGLTARLSWATRLGHLPLRLTWQPSLPVGGCFFAPDYGELYYEIYLGNHSGLARAAWWGNYFSLGNLITADLRIGATSLRLGYRCDYLSTKASHITSRAITHSAVIGISGEWLSVDPRRPANAATRLISPL